MIAIVAVVAGVTLAATASVYNGQWLLGATLAGLGLAYLWHNRKDKTRA